MRTCIVQIKSEKGKLQANIQHHLKFVERALKLDADLIVFPELSITNYEPQLAHALAVIPEDPVLNPFQDLADKNQTTIGIGMPIRATDGITISMLIFQPHKRRAVYSKGLLHSDELPYFVPGNNHPFLTIKGKKIAFGICYETLQRTHFEKANENNTDIFVASVAKPDRGTDQAYVHFPSMAKEFEIPVLMSNAVGRCDNFLSNGLSATWNAKGELAGQLDKENEGLLIYDTETEKADIHYYT